jgi:DNA ligase-1
MKPMLASDWIESKVKFPVIAQPKVDGVRGLNMFGTLTGRSLKKFKNVHVTNLLSHSALIGLDGEIAASSEIDPDLCRLTSSALGTIKGQPYVLWWLFDYVTPITRLLGYEQRFNVLLERMGEISVVHPNLGQHLRAMPRRICNTIEELEEFDLENLEWGFEGTCFRDANGLHKQGRSTPTEGGLLRIKRFVDFEFTVDAVIEGEENQNEAQTNELGHTFRSSHQENKVSNGMIGAMEGTVLNVVKDSSGNVLLQAGQRVRVSAGCLSHEQRLYYFANKLEFMSLIHKAKFFPKGIKDKPRFPTWQSFRSPEDIS